MGCEPFQIAVERGLHGALPDREREALARHLAGCEACRAYEAAAREAEEAMAANAEEALRGVDWRRVERGIREGVRSAMRGLVAVLALLALEGLRHGEIADVLGVPEGTVWSRLHAARRRLAAELGAGASPAGPPPARLRDP